MSVPDVDSTAPSRRALPAYFADYEEHFDLAVRRPVRVGSVRRAGDGPHGGRRDHLVVVVAERGSDIHAGTDSSGGSYTERWAAGYVINATGTWFRPFWPHHPGREAFRGRQLHVYHYVAAEEFAGQRVVIVGAGISATQLLEEISLVADTVWVTRRPVQWETGSAPANFSAAIERVADRTREGQPPESVISVSGQFRDPSTYGRPRAGSAWTPAERSTSRDSS